MFTRGLSQQTQKNLETLGNIPFGSKYYLVGGTALSLHLEHRYSHDLDFFSQTPEKSVIIISQLKDKGDLEVLQNTEGAFNGFLNGVKLSFFLYPYRLLHSPETFKNIKIAHYEDIACMKIDAISSRGTKRDFIDLFTICNTKKSLGEVLALFEKKYHDIKVNKLHILKSLVYFQDAENDEMPQMLKKIDWNDVKKFFQREVTKIIEA